jgi:hypothetical protein
MGDRQPKRLDGPAQTIRAVLLANATPRPQNDSATSKAALQYPHIFSRRRFLRACLAARLSARLLRRCARLSAAVAASALSGAPTSINAAAPPKIAARNLRLV